MPRNNTNNDLDSGNINLLPDEMRVAEEKDLKSGRSNESPYQLRAPKKERRRRSAFAWLPFFGGTHWDASVEVAEEHKGKLSADAATVGRVTTPIPEPPREGMLQPSEAPIRPVTEEGMPVRISALPVMRPSEKRGVRFSGLPSWFGRKKMRGAPSLPRSSAPSMRTPSRHYSLLEQEEQSADVPKVATIGAPLVEPKIGFVTTFGEAQRQTASVPGTAARTSRGIRWPRWLDIFYLIGLFAGGGKPKRPRAPHVPKPSARPSQPAVQPIAPVMPVLSTRPEPPVQKVTESYMPFEHGPITPVPEAGSVRRKRGFFDWLASLFARKPKQPKMPKVPRTPEAALRSVPPQPSKTGIRTEVRVEQIQPVPTPAPSLMPAIPSSRSFDAVTPPPSLTAAPEVPSAERPAPQQPAHGGMLPMQPITPEGGDSAGKGKPPKGPKLTGLHMPAKFSFEAPDGLREVNLIPGDFSLKSWKQIGQLMILIVVAVGAVTGIAYALLNAWETQVTNRTAEIDSEIQKFTTDIQVFRNEEPRMTAIGTRIELINQLLARHIYWTQFLALLEKYTLPDVYYDGVSATTNGTLSLSAHGSSFETVTRALLLLSSEDAQEFVSSVSVGGANRADSAEGIPRVDFIIDLTLNPNLFFYHDASQTQ